MSAQLKVLTQPRLLMVYAISALGYGGTFTAFTFLAPILEQVSGFSSSAIGLIMLVYGVSVAIGNIWGGKMADKMGPIKALTVIISGLAAVLVVFNFTAVNPVAAVATILVWDGGLIVAEAGLMHTPWVGAVIVLIALALIRLSGKLDKNALRDENVEQNHAKQTV